MVCNFLSNLVVITHLLFIVFVTLGALLVLKWPKIAWIHIPFALWGVLVEYLDIVCPLTPLENYFRRMGGVTAAMKWILSIITLYRLFILMSSPGICNLYWVLLL